MGGKTSKPSDEKNISAPIGGIPASERVQTGLNSSRMRKERRLRIIAARKAKAEEKESIKGRNIYIEKWEMEDGNHKVVGTISVPSGVEAKKAGLQTGHSERHMSDIRKKSAGYKSLPKRTTHLDQGGKKKSKKQECSQLRSGLLKQSNLGQLNTLLQSNNSFPVPASSLIPPKKTALTML